MTSPNNTAPETDQLLDAIRTCRTLNDFIAVYDSDPFQHSLARLATWTAQKPQTISVETWAQQWASAVAARDPDALALNRDRKTCLQLLYSLCDCWRPKTPQHATVNEADIVGGFRDQRVSNVLQHCVVMDRAQSLYVMRLPGASRAGMHWYAEKHMADEAWRKRLEGYAGRHTMNKRILWLVEDLDDELGLNRGALKTWIQPELVPVS